MTENNPRVTVRYSGCKIRRERGIGSSTRRCRCKRREKGGMREGEGESIHGTESRNSFMENSRFFISVSLVSPYGSTSGVAVLATRASASHPPCRGGGV